jgi:hypothetical protein
MGVYVIGKSITDNFLSEKIFNNGKIKPAFIGADVGNITDPDGIWSRYSKLGCKRLCAIGYE